MKEDKKNSRSFTHNFLFFFFLISFQWWCELHSIDLKSVCWMYLCFSQNVHTNVFFIFYLIFVFAYVQIFGCRMIELENKFVWFFFVRKIFIVLAYNVYKRFNDSILDFPWKYLCKNGSFFIWGNIFLFCYFGTLAHDDEIK